MTRYRTVTTALERKLRELVGERVAQARMRANLSQRELGGSSGVHPAALSSLENGRRAPRVDELFRLAACLGCEALDLIPRSIEFERPPPRGGG